MSQLIDDYPMLLFALEAGVALFLLIFIVWWTLPKKQRTPSNKSSSQ